MRHLGALLVVVTIHALAASAFEVESTWDHRVTAFGWDPPPASVVEGSITGTFAGDETMDLIGGDPRFTRVSDAVFRRQFLWLDPLPVLGVFQGRSSGGVDSVWAVPEPQPILLPGNHSLPILHLETDPTGLWSAATGIYVWGAMEPNWDERGDLWERPAQLTMWDAAGTPLVVRPVGLRINGGWTRCLPQKSLRLYLDREDQPELVHDFFGDGATASERLLLRQTVWCQFLLKDHWATSLYRDLGHLTSRWTPAVAYLNDEYWGAYGLRERLDDEWATTTLGLDPDEIVLVKDGETLIGDPDAWTTFLTWVDTRPEPGAHEFFVAVSQQLDLNAYTDWLFVNIMATSGENGSYHNLVVLREPDGCWRLVMWDEDNIIFADNVDTDYFRFYSADSAAEYASNWPPVSYFPSYEDARLYCRLFRQLMGNAEYRALLSRRGEDLLQGAMSVPAMQARMDSVQTLFAPELSLHGSRFAYSDLQDLDDNVAIYNDILSQRHGVVAAQLARFLDESMDPVELSSFTAVGGRGGASLIWRTERERDNLGFDIWRAVGDPDAMVRLVGYDEVADLAGAAYADTARTYSYLDTTAPADITAWYQLRHTTGLGGVVVHDWLEFVGPVPLPPLAINEFLADNVSVNPDEMGEFDDWLELYNAGTVPVEMVGLYLTDDLTSLLKWPLPAGTLAPGAHLLVWCDNDPEQGALHASFKLGAGGEEIGLSALIDNEPQLVDSVTFGPQTTDVSLGRLPDGADLWQFFSEPTPGGPNGGEMAAPDATLATVQLRGVTPNPGGGPAAIRFVLGRSQPVSVDVYDLRGRRLRRLHVGELDGGEHQLLWDRRHEDGRPAAAGVYLLRIEAGADMVTAKITVVR